MVIKLPTFLIVGAAKSGTSSLHRYLNQHPDIYMPKNKEPRFFVSSIIKNLNINDPRYEAFCKTTAFSYENYIELFKNVNKEKAIGEASTTYLYYYESAIPHIRNFLENVKIMIILRNPIDRAFSSYTHLSRDRFETLSFETCLKLEKKRIKENWSILNFYKDVGFYYKQVKAYKDTFSDVMVRLFDDLKEAPLLLVKDIYEFLGVKDSFVPDTRVRYNVSGIPSSKMLNDFFVKRSKLQSITRAVGKFVLKEDRWIILREKLRSKLLIEAEMEPETRQYLKGIYREDILKLQDLINRDLSHWLR